MSGRMAAQSDTSLLSLTKPPQDASEMSQDGTVAKPVALKDVRIVRDKDGTSYLLSAKSEWNSPAVPSSCCKTAPLPHRINLRPLGHTSRRAPVSLTLLSNAEPYLCRCLRCLCRISIPLFWWWTRRWTQIRVWHAAGRTYTQGVVPLSLSPPHIDRTTQYRNSPPSLICRVAREPQFEADP